jgi:hypothetical protein
MERPLQPTRSMVRLIDYLSFIFRLYRIDQYRLTHRILLLFRQCLRIKSLNYVVN